MDNLVAPPVVVGVDGSATALDAVLWAADDCARHHVPLLLVHCYSLPTRGYPDMLVDAQGLLTTLQDLGTQWLDEAAVAALAAAPGITVQTRSVMAPDISQLIDESAHARMVVVGSRGLGGFTGILLGSTAAALAAHAHSPTVVVRGTTTADGPVVVGVDGSPTSEAAIGFAFEAASVREAPLTAVLSWTDPLLEDAVQATHFTATEIEAVQEREILLAERLAGWQEKYPDVAVERIVVRDRPVRALLRIAEHARLLVVGSRGHGGFTGMLLGSTSQALVNHAPCPVAIVRPV
ncbi:universal stress protein [Umezawaea sp. Da 62-37]|uniref:universal stress protein n=1 Tax=Umezawaea sp. Da 62-37 TaxID=3075927 RepID=UPI0028F6E924|nr:universal stress protein [Umezawaea sp. Da 62-37]WNV87440.1 universal stress protein [Umezawaea sp. Da 62-37]